MTLYFSGDGTQEGLICAYDTKYTYENMIMDIARFAENQTKEVKSYKTLQWDIKLYIDASHSGAAINQAIQFSKSHGGNDTELELLDQDCKVTIQIFTSSDGLAYDR